ncbi:hypothetical protein ABW20_dc0107924 [Dactylellina cionopaga]|nr:hypothetical protein ABW20_dc0107924 [Dactylellina cionopaga]
MAEPSPLSSSKYQNTLYPTRRPKNPARSCNCPPWRPFELADAGRESLYLTDSTNDFTCREHYIAVSYCWKSQKGGQQEDKRFKIRTQNTLHKGIAPREIVERAIKFAANVGARFIWIDQECIKQDNIEDQELGIHSMDLVYKQSNWPLALMDTVFTDASHILALQQAYKRGEAYLTGKSQLHSPVTQEELLAVTDAMHLLSQDRWLTRAWILQESILSGAIMSFLCRSSVENSGGMFAGPLGELKFNMQELKFLKGSVAAYLQFSTIPGMFPEPQGDSNKYLYELQAASNGFITRITMGERRWGSSHAFTALAAFNLLEGYINSRVADRLAILANLCDYQIRLDTTVLTSLGYGFATCFLALSLLNGDISLLQFWSELNLNTLPYELKKYRVVESMKETGSFLNFPTSWDTFSWLPDLGTCLSSENEYNFVNLTVQAKGTTADGSNTALDPDPGLKLRAFQGRVLRAARMGLAEEGLAFDGWLWTCAYAIDFRLLQNQWRKDSLAFEEIESSGVKDGITLWTPSVEVIKTILMFTVGKDVGEILWKKAMTTEISLDRYGVPPGTKTLLTDFIDPESLQFIGDMKWPDCTENEFFRLLRDSVVTDGSPWRWIVPLVVRTGMLQIWRIYYPATGDIRWYSCGVFDCVDSISASESGFEGKPEGFRGGVDAVLVPKMVLSGDLAYARTAVDGYLQPRPSSWATIGVRASYGEGQSAFLSKPVLKGQGMIRGIWDIDQAVPSHYVLS